MGFPGDLAVNNPPAMQKMLVQSIGWEDPLEKKMTTHSNFPAWEIPWTEEPDKLQSMGSQRHGHDLVAKPPPPPYTYVCVCFLCKYSGALTGVHSIDKLIFTSLFLVLTEVQHP